MAGDFNASPDSPEVERIAAGWVDAWQDAVEMNAATAYRSRQSRQPLHTHAARTDRLKGTTLAWSGSSAASVTVFRNGQSIANVGNTGGYVDIIARPAGSYDYKVCATGTSTCSNTATIRFSRLPKERR